MCGETCVGVPWVVPVGVCGERSGAGGHDRFSFRDPADHGGAGAGGVRQDVVGGAAMAGD